MIHLTALDAARLLGGSPKVRTAANQVRKAQQVTSLHDKVLELMTLIIWSSAKGVME